MAKSKRKQPADNSEQHDTPDAEAPSTSGRSYTVSLAVSSSMIDNTQNLEFATFVAGQVRLSRLL